MTHFPTTTHSLAAHDDDYTMVVAPEDRTIVIPPRTPDDYAVALPGGRRLLERHVRAAVVSLSDIHSRSKISSKPGTSCTDSGCESHKRRPPGSATA